MATPNFQNRTLFKGDNLDFLQGMNSETVDLIATDPPFNKGKDFYATPESLSACAKFQDRWRWDEDVQPEWVDAIKDDQPRVYELIDFVIGGLGRDSKERKKIGGREDLATFLCFMGVRLFEMRRVLKDTGSLYLHCDATASHYLKALCDAIFGDRHFRNEIVWRKYAGRKNNATTKFTTQHDVLLFYVKSNKARLNPVMIPHSDEEIKKKYIYTDDDGRRYRLAWGRRFQTTGENRKLYLDESPGRAVGNLWVEDGLQLNTSSQERTGYPTQKPLALYERIIMASSNEGDIVLDPFCGCATTPIAAERLGRQWVGMDLWDGAYEIVKRRMEENKQLLADGNPQIILRGQGDIPVRTDGDDTDANYLPPIYRRNRQSSIPRAEMMRILVEKWGLVCWGCGFEPPTIDFLDLDHNTPASSGGSNELHNRAPLCGPCNRRKSNTWTLEGLRRDNKKAGRWYGNIPIDKKVPLRLAFDWAAEYLAERARQAELAVSA